MALEIERKFLVLNDDWLPGEPGKKYRQGYIVSDETMVVRVRTASEKAYLTIKSSTDGSLLVRAEYEYEIPRADAEAMLSTLCSNRLVEKTRYRRPIGDLVWEIDVFEGLNKGLILAEVELPTADFPVPLPPWVGQEVTEDPRYANAVLAEKPYGTWQRAL